MAENLLPDSDSYDPAMIASIDATALDAIDWADEVLSNPSLLPTYTAEDAEIEDESLQAIAACRGFRGAATATTTTRRRAPASDESGDPSLAKRRAIVPTGATAAAAAATTSTTMCITTDMMERAAAAARAVGSVAVSGASFEAHRGGSGSGGGDGEEVSMPVYTFENHVVRAKDRQPLFRRPPRIPWSSLRNDCVDPYQLLGAAARALVRDSIGSGSIFDGVEALLWPLAFRQSATSTLASLRRIYYAVDSLEGLGAVRTAKPEPPQSLAAAEVRSYYLDSDIYVVVVIVRGAESSVAVASESQYFYVVDDGGGGTRPPTTGDGAGASIGERSDERET